MPKRCSGLVCGAELVSLDVGEKVDDGRFPPAFELCDGRLQHRLGARHHVERVVLIDLPQPWDLTELVERGWPLQTFKLQRTSSTRCASMSHLRTWSKIRTVDLVWLGLWGGVAWQAQVLLCFRLEADLPIGTEAVDGGCVLGM